MVRANTVFPGNPKFVIAGGFLAVMVLMLAVVVTGFIRLTDTMETTERRVSSQNLKTHLVMEMYSAVRERSVSLQVMINTSDPFQREEEYDHFTRQASRFMVSNQALSDRLAADREHTFFRKLKDLLKVSAPLQVRVAQKAAEGRHVRAAQLLLSKAMPAQGAVLQTLQDLLEYERLETEKTLSQVKTREHETLMGLAFLLLIAGLLIITVYRFVIRRLALADRALFAQVTLSSIGDAVITTDTVGHINYVNARATDLLGQDEADMVGKTLSEVFLSRLSSSCAEGPDQLVLDQGEHFSGERKLTTLDGREACIDISLSPIEYSSDHWLGTVVSFRDITRRKQAEEKLRSSEERMRLIMRGTNDGIWDYDLTSGELYFSPRWKTMLGYDEDKPVRSFYEWQRLIHPGDLGEILLIWTDCMSGDKTSYAIEYRMKMRSGEWKWVECRGIVQLNDDGHPVRLAGSHTDISERKESQEKLHWESTHDWLTRLANRREFERVLSAELKQIRGTPEEHAVLYIDLDQFKVVNDTCGHVAGDELLRQVSAILMKRIRGSDMLARLGGDEFGIFLKGCPPSRAIGVSDVLRETIEENGFIWDNKIFKITASIGVVTISSDNATKDEVLGAADIACFTAKEQGRNRVHVYKASDEELELHKREMSWVSRVTRALQEQRLVLYRQPIVPVDAAGSRPHHQEVLIRMLDEDGSLIPPGAFIPAAERYNLMPAVDRWVIRTLFTKLAASKANGGPDGELINTVNLSGSSINEEGFLEFIKDQFRQFPILPSMICFEVTETAAISNLTQAAVFIRELKALGCLFALDDFGSGLSSFGYLKNLPVDYLKIDGQFVKDMVDDEIDAAMVASINQIGQVMGMQTIAEFVENDEILAKLAGIGVDYAQGYGIAKPAPFDTPVTAQQSLIAQAGSGSPGSP